MSDCLMMPNAIGGGRREDPSCEDSDNPRGRTFARHGAVGT